MNNGIPKSKSLFNDLLDLGIPLFTSDSNKDYGYIDAYLGIGLLWGWTATSGAPEADIDNFASINIWLPGLVTFNYHMSKKFDVELGYGIGWNNYRKLDDKRFMLNSDKVVEMIDYPEGSKPDFSRIKVISSTMSLTGKYHFAKDAYLRVGPVFSFNDGLSVKTKYKDASGKKVIDKQNNPKANFFRMEWVADVQYDDFGFFVKYSPKNVLRDGFGPQFSTVSVGVSIGW